MQLSKYLPATSPNSARLKFWATCRAVLKVALLLVIVLGGSNRVSAAPLRALFYGPTSAPNGLAETFVNSAGSGFAPIGLGATDSKVWTESEWSAKTAADFAQFDIIVFGDQPAGSADASRWNTAIANRSVWSTAVTGNALVLGTDPDYHAANFPFITPDIVRQALLFGANQTAYPQHVTGLFVALSEVSFGNSQGPGRVELLAGIGDFMAVHVAANDAAKIASHPVVDCLPDNYLPGWGYSAHQGFYSYPAAFKPLAVVTSDAGHSTPGLVRPCHLYPDSFCVDWALVYILARGSFNELTTTTCLQAGSPGQSRTITAQFRTNPGDVPIPNRRIGFTVTGANAGAGGTYFPASHLTDANGQVSFTYTGGANSGKDTVTIFADDNANGVRNQCEAETLAVVNWAAQTVTVTAFDPSASESGDTGTFRFARTGNLQGDIEVHFCVTGSAISSDSSLPNGSSSILMQSGSQYVDLLVTPVDDNLVEGPETLVVTLQDDPNQPPTYAVGSPLQATITIADNPLPVVTVSASGAPSEATLAQATYTFSRTGTPAQLAEDLTVHFSLPVEVGSALLGADYALDVQTSGEITFDQNESSKAMLLTPLQDTRSEGNETVKVQILSDPAYQLGNPAAATLTIQDNDNVSLSFSYSITALGPANKVSHAFGINNPGRVTGDYRFVSPYWWRGFSWYNGSLTTIGVITAYNCGAQHLCASSYGVAINDSGVVAGYGGFADGEGYPQELPFRWTSGAPTELERLDYYQDVGNRAVAVNNNGDVVGFSSNSSGKTRAALWTAGSTLVQDLNSLAGIDATKESLALGLGSSGRIVGKSMIAANNTTFHAFRTQGLQTIDSGDDLGNLLGVESQNSEANAINDFNEVAGATIGLNGQYHAFWKDGHSGKNQGFIDLGALPGDDKSIALGLSNYGHAVGYSLNTESGNQRAVVWFSNGVMWDLTAQVGAANGWVLKSATAINNDGWIVGWGVKGGIERGFLLVPNAY